MTISVEEQSHFVAVILNCVCVSVDGARVISNTVSRVLNLFTGRKAYLSQISHERGFSYTIEIVSIQCDFAR